MDGTEYVCSDEDFEIELTYLKQKQDAGGDAIITQLFYDYDVFASFEKQCRAKGIHIPIPPGMMLELDRLKGDDCKEAFIEFGVQWVTNMCQKIVASKKYPGLHFYCLNASERTYQIMERLGYLRPS